MTLYKNKYRVESTRLTGWDYSRNGYYLVTICTKNKIPFFGEIDNGKMVLSEIGKIVEREWLKTERLRDNMQFDTWVIMPNHVHGIVIIDNPTTNQPTVETHGDASLVEDDHDNSLETHRHASLQVEQKIIIQNLSNIIRQFKSVARQCIHKNGYTEFSWHSRFHEHIIRTEKSLQKIREYIVNNPLKWELDKYYIEL